MGRVGNAVRWAPAGNGIASVAAQRLIPCDIYVWRDEPGLPYDQVSPRLSCLPAHYDSKAAHQVYRFVPGAERHLQRLVFHKKVVTIDLENSKVSTA